MTDMKIKKFYVKKGLYSKKTMAESKSLTEMRDYQEFLFTSEILSFCMEEIPKVDGHYALK